MLEVPEIDVQTLAGELAQGARLIDVRQLDEWEEARVPGVPLIPLDQLLDRIGEIPNDERVYVICKSGGRSGQAVEYLNANGYDTVNVAGGTMGWISAGEQVDSGPA